MLEILNRYANGLASIPILQALRERGCLARLAGPGPFTAEEVVQLSDLIADIAPDRRANAVAFAHVLNRLFEQNQRMRKK